MKNDYYNRPQIQSSYKIAVISMICVILMLIGIGVLEIIKKVSAKETDFDNTSIKIKKDLPIETLLQKQERYKGYWV